MLQVEEGGIEEEEESEDYVVITLTQVALASSPNPNVISSSTSYTWSGRFSTKLPKINRQSLLSKALAF
jgi:hypothetical protein